MTENHWWLDRMLAPLAGQRIDGGCDDCHAYQELEQVEPGVWVLNVRHDNTCPFLASLDDRRKGRRR